MYVYTMCVYVCVCVTFQSFMKHSVRNKYLRKLFIAFIIFCSSIEVIKYITIKNCNGRYYILCLLRQDSFTVRNALVKISHRVSEWLLIK